MPATPSLDPATNGVVDDGRRWWAVQGNQWSAPWLVATRQARMAVAELKRGLFDVETRSNGSTHRDAHQFIAAMDLACVGGPYTTTEAFDLDIRWRLAWAVVNTSASIEVALSPIGTIDDCYPLLTEQQVASHIATCASMYRRGPK